MSFFKRYKKRILTIAAAAAVVGSGGAVVQYTQAGLAVLEVIKAIDTRVDGQAGDLKPEYLVPAPAQ